MIYLPINMHTYKIIIIIVVVVVIIIIIKVIDNLNCILLDSIVTVSVMFRRF
jgi:hypothetical protein